MKMQYRVQCYYHYKDGTSEWEKWGANEDFTSVDLAEQEKRRGESMYPDHQFRVVARSVSNWVRGGEMTNENETVADVVDEMRKCADSKEQGDEYAVATDTLRVMADRIEAAFVRNNDEYNVELTRLREALREIATLTADSVPTSLVGRVSEIAAGALPGEWRLIEEVIASRVVAQNKGGAE